MPILRTYPFIKIWHAGCASGEEVYSMAILLKEEGLLHKSILYGTDINGISLRRAEEGVFRQEEIKKAEDNYRESGGKSSLGDYFVKKYDLAKIHHYFKKSIVFSSHNLVSDENFGEMHVILCRNVFIYFNDILKRKVLNSFHEAIVHRGFFCLGPKETLEFLDAGDQFELISRKERIYQKGYIPK